jgi:hypothetical protein
MESQLVTNMCCILASPRPKETDDKKVFTIEVKPLTLEEQREIIKKFRREISLITKDYVKKI